MHDKMAQRKQITYITRCSNVVAKVAAQFIAWDTFKSVDNRTS